MVMNERVIWVDEHNDVLGSVTRQQVRISKLCHRATYVFVFNSKGQLVVQERTLTKDIYPGYFDPATGGVVSEGEYYDQAAYRELEEELGITDVILTPHFHFFFKNEDCQVWGKVYSCKYDGGFACQPDEVAGTLLEFPRDILANRFNRLYTPDSLVALKRFLAIRQRG